MWFNLNVLDLNITNGADLQAARLYMDPSHVQGFGLQNVLRGRSLGRPSPFTSKMNASARGQGARLRRHWHGPPFCHAD